MLWRHISQLFTHRGDPAGVAEGARDCAEASVARYLREARYPWPAADPAADDAALVRDLRARMTNRPDQAGQPGTTLTQVAAYLDATGIPFRPSRDPSDAARPWTLSLVRGGRLRPPQYDPSWVGGATALSHYILSLGDGWYNDPLAFANGQRDCQYAPEAVRAAAQDSYLFVLVDPTRLHWCDGHAETLPAPPSLAPTAPR